VGLRPHRGPRPTGSPPTRLLVAGAVIRTTVAERRAEPTDDLISEMVRAQEDGDRLSDLEIVSLCVQLMVAGNVTTSDLLGSGLYWLDRNPEQRERLLADPALLPGAVEEMLRYDCPHHRDRSHRSRRRRGRGVSGASGRHGDRVARGGQPRPGRFPDPHTFDVGRDATGHLGFGSGVHVCLGAPLARSEVRIALERFLAAHPGYEVVDERARRRSLPFFRGFESLPVRV
jgi:cytochrome P450